MADPDLPPSFWATPGGGVEANESDEEAACRELREELSLHYQSSSSQPSDGEPCLTGPLHSETAHWTQAGERVQSTDIFFAARCSAAMPRLAGLSPEERHTLRGLRWWTADELVEALKKAQELIFPQSLPELLHKARSACGLP